MELLFIKKFTQNLVQNYPARTPCEPIHLVVGLGGSSLCYKRLGVRKTAVPLTAPWSRGSFHLVN